MPGFPFPPNTCELLTAIPWTDPDRRSLHTRSQIGIQANQVQSRLQGAGVQIQEWLMPWVTTAPGRLINLRPVGKEPLVYICFLFWGCRVGGGGHLHSYALVRHDR